MCQLKNIYLIKIITLITVFTISTTISKPAYCDNSSFGKGIFQVTMQNATITDLNFISKLDSLIRTTHLAKLPFYVISFGVAYDDKNLSDPSIILIDNNRPIEQNMDIYIMVQGIYYPEDVLGNIITRYNRKYYIFSNYKKPRDLLIINNQKQTFEYKQEELVKSMTIQPITVVWKTTDKMEDVSNICPPW